MSLNIMFICTVASCAAHDIAFEPFFKEVETFSKNEGYKRGKIHVASNYIAIALVGMTKWIGKDIWKTGFGNMFLGYGDAMAIVAASMLELPASRIK